MTQKEVILALFRRDHCLQALILCFLALIALLLTKYGILPNNATTRLVGVLFGILTPSVFDALGFRLTQDRDDPVSVNRSIYRVIQNMSQWGAFYVIVGLISGCFVALGCALAWWCCTNDYLFYKLRKEPKQGNMDWLSWSILGVVFRMKLVQWNTFRLSALLGVVVAVVLALL